ncbi:MAG TPA: TetR/AcrR family transcriptional regulator [Verrucomicrobiae bacterium]|nr:TetR/AcrR family transcriptional regulator [Verrucomicrobiae bacterium]
MQREDKFEKILDAAIQAIAESGYHQCQVAKIARLAGVANGTIYLYFKNKDEILIRVFQERMGEFVTSLRKELANCRDSRERLKVIINKHLTSMENNYNLAVVTQLELRQSDGHVRTAIMDTIRQYFRLIEEVIVQGVDRGEMKLVSVRSARQLIFGTLDQATTDWVLARKRRKLTEQSADLLDLFTGALRLS